MLSEGLPSKLSPKRGSLAQSGVKPSSHPLPVLRKYLGPLRRLGDQEWALRLGTASDSWYFLLGSAQLPPAEQRAEELRRLAGLKGLAAVSRRISREFTIAIHWLDQPRACTYTTLCTLPEKQAPAVPPTASTGSTRPVRLGLLESDPTVRDALVFWLGRIPGIVPVVINPARATDREGVRTELILCNAYSAELNFFSLQETWQRTAPGMAVLGYSIVPTSDDVFVQMSGGQHGYFLHRRPPAEMLEPLGLPLEPLPHSEELLRLRFGRYFQNLFTTVGSTAAGLVNPYHLTPRETDVLGGLQRGLQDKEIAQAIGISPQTVHTHLKRIFEKLGAHTRTEAVMKFLQK